MAQPKYEKWLLEENLILIRGWAMNGLSYDEIAHNMGIHRATLDTWRKKYSDINDSLKIGREVASFIVENALFKSCTGYNATIKKTFKCKRVEYENGKRVLEEEELKVGYDEVHVPANVTAQIFFLCNKRKEDYQNVNKIEPKKDNDNDKNTGVVLLPPVLDDGEVNNSE